MEAYALLLAGDAERRHRAGHRRAGAADQRKAGIVNLGAEGMMLCAAVAGFAAVVHSGNDGSALPPAWPPGRCWRPFGWLVIWLGTNQYATGLALSPVRGSASRPSSASATCRRSCRSAAFNGLGLGDMPLIGPALFRHHPLVYGAMAAGAGADLVPVPHARRAGAALGRRVARVGARAGLSGARIRLLAVVAGGALCGLAGAYLSVIYTRCGWKAWWPARAGSRWR